MRCSSGFTSARQTLKVHSERCRPCTVHRMSCHSFSTSTRTYTIPPESPQFIHVPQAAQPSYPPRRQVKGTLPVPREIFRGQRANKATPEYLTAVTAEPRSSPDGTGSDESGSLELRERLAWKRRMAATRRRNLRESLVELHRRKVGAERFVAARSARRRAERETAVNQKQREDERLTAPTITAAMKQLQLGPPPDPDREARLEAKAANVRAREAACQEKRQTLLHTLYANARLFITSEAHLDRAIAMVFQESPKEWEHGTIGKNIWNLGPPMSVQDLVDGVNKNEKLAVKQRQGSSVKTHQRVMRIGEELTGGKMDPSDWKQSVDELTGGGRGMSIGLRSSPDQGQR